MGGAPAVALATVAFALVHSALASRTVKRLVRRAVGGRGYDGWYRVAYNAQAGATCGALVAWSWRRPSRTLWHVRGPLAALMRAGQLAGLAAGVWAVRELGLAYWAGAEHAGAWLAGRDPMPPAPEGQGPGANADGTLRGTGPYAHSRHPLNVVGLPILWLQPRMTANLAAFNLVATAYFVAGTVPEERRLARRHGAAYAAYRRSGVPRFWPRLRPALAAAAAAATAPSGGSATP